MDWFEIVVPEASGEVVFSGFTSKWLSAFKMDKMVTRGRLSIHLQEAPKLSKEWGEGQGVDVAVFLEWRALVSFVEKNYPFSSSVAKHAAPIAENAKKMGLSTDPMELLRAARAAGVPVYACAVEAALTGFTEKVPPEIKLLEEADLTKPIIEAKKIIGGM